MSFAENPDDMKMESVELTGVYPHFKSFDEALKVVEKKQKQYGTEPVKFSLLVFVNHEKSEEWINMLREKVISGHPFAPNFAKTKRGANGKFLPKLLLFHLQTPFSSPRHNYSHYFFRSGLFEDFFGFAHCRAGGQDIVNQDYFFAFYFFRISCFKSADDVGQSFFLVFYLHLRFCVEFFKQNVRADIGGQFSGDQLRLIVAPMSQFIF